MFRIANKRTSQLVDADVQVTLNRIDVVNGEERRMFYPLKLERHRINMMPLTWTVVHPITEESPLYGRTIEGWKRRTLRYWFTSKLLMKPFPITCIPVSPTKENLIWGARFILNFRESPDGATIHYVSHD